MTRQLNDFPGLHPAHAPHANAREQFASLMASNTHIGLLRIWYRRNPVPMGIDIGVVNVKMFWAHVSYAELFFMNVLTQLSLGN